MFFYIVCLISVVFIILVMNTYIVEQITYRIPSELLSNNIRIVHISDIHGRTKFLNGKISEKINRINPDIVFITGDLVSKQQNLQNVISELGNIICPNIFFVPGNYEKEETVYFKKRMLSNREYDTIKNAVKRQNIVFLENSYELIEVNGLRIFIYGFDNSIYGNEYYIKNIDQKSCDIKIFLAHSPNIIKKISEYEIDYDLLLVGHTHGGQIRLFNKTIGSYKDFHIGCKKTSASSYFFINRGLGTVRIPFRFNCKPEISEILFRGNGETIPK